MASRDDPGLDRAGGDRAAGSRGDSAAGRLAHRVAGLQAALLVELQGELAGADVAEFASAARRLAEDFGAVAATAVDAASAPAREASPAPAVPEQPPAAARSPRQEPPASSEADLETACLESLFRPGHMRRRLDQMVETHRRYRHPFAIAVFDASGPDTRDGEAGGGQETVLAVVGAALRDSTRLVDEVFQLEEDALCVLAPNLGTVEAVQMAERLLGLLEELERAGGLRIAVSAGVVACPEHGEDAQVLLKKADAAMWRARAVGQPVGVGALTS